MKNDITYLGRVINVNSNTIEVEISKEIPSAAPIINGRVYKIGQLGTFVKFPVGSITLFGIVSSVSNVQSNIETNQYLPDYGSRYLQVQLIGEKLGNSKFEKGIGSYPTINDEVHLVTEDDLKIIYGNFEKGLLQIGHHSSSTNLPVFLDLHHLILRHSAILGSTGSGKSNSTANIIKGILENYKGSRIVLVDIHGEYQNAFADKAKVFRINDNNNPLYIPFWTMNFDELSFFLVGRPTGQEQPSDKRLREEILSSKKENIDKLGAGKINEEYITADSPIPFDLRKLWYKFNREINATYSHTSNHSTDTEELLKEGDPASLAPADFEPYGLGGGAPFKSKEQIMFSYESKIYSRLKDTRFNFMFNPDQYADPSGKNDLNELLSEWIDNEERLTILDLSGIPFELIDISVGLITRIIFDSMYWGRDENYTGRNRPILMAYEEAHTYLPKGEKNSQIYGYARKSVEKIFKEGRKFGIGALVVSQRPSEISETILAQVGTFISLRLTNSSDKNTVQSASPNNMTNLIDLLPSLRIGEAIIVGEAITIPTRVRIELIEPRPSSNDPELVNNWEKDFKEDKNRYKEVVTAMRELKHISKEK